MPPPVEPRLVRSPSVLTRSGSFGVAVLARAGPIPITLQGTGRDVWESLATEHTEAALVEELASRYGVAATIVAEDLRPALEHLMAYGLITAVP